MPFGFGISHRATIVVSEAGASTVSSYRLGPGGALRAITASLPVGFGRGLLGRRLARRPLRLHRQRLREHQRLRDRPDGSLAAERATALTALSPR